MPVGIARTRADQFVPHVDARFAEEHARLATYRAVHSCQDEDIAIRSHRLSNAPDIRVLRNPWVDDRTGGSVPARDTRSSRWTLEVEVAERQPVRLRRTAAGFSAEPERPAPQGCRVSGLPAYCCPQTHSCTLLVYVAQRLTRSSPFRRAAFHGWRNAVRFVRIAAAHGVSLSRATTLGHENPLRDPPRTRARAAGRLAAVHPRAADRAAESGLHLRGDRHTAAGPAIVGVPRAAATVGAPLARVGQSACRVPTYRAWEDVVPQLLRARLEMMRPDVVVADFQHDNRIAEEAVRAGVPTLLRAVSASCVERRATIPNSPHLLAYANSSFVASRLRAQYGSRPRSCTRSCGSMPT